LNDFTMRMSVRDYLYYQNCRSVSFVLPTPGHSSHKFAEWILTPERKSQLTLKLNGLAMESLQHLAHETVAILVELSLLVQQDSARSFEVPSEHPTYLHMPHWGKLPHGISTWAKPVPPQDKKKPDVKIDDLMIKEERKRQAARKQIKEND